MSCSVDEVNGVGELINDSPLVPVTRWKPPKLPDTSQCIYGILTHIDDLGQIYCQLSADKEILKYIRQVIDLNYNELEERSVLDRHWKSGDACLSLFRDDRYHRAVVTDHQTTKDGKIQVLFVDFGNKTFVDPLDLITPFHLHDVPIMCIRLIMDDIVPRSYKGSTITRPGCLYFFIKLSFICVDLIINLFLAQLDGQFLSDFLHKC